MTDRLPTVVIVEPEQRRSQFERAREQGVAQTTFALPDAPWEAAGITCVADVGAANRHEARRAVLRGADLVISLPEEEWVAPFVRDLGRLATVHLGSVEPTDPLAALNHDQRDLLIRLADGQSIPQAAAELYLSVRTAERRLGAARRLLGVRTTAEAVLVAGGQR